MPILVGDAPPAPPPAPHDPGVGYVDFPTQKWTGWNGEEFPLAGDFKSMTLLTESGRTGMLEPTYEHQFTESATLDGAQWDGYRTTIRKVGWPLFIWATTGTEFRAEQDRFLRTMQPDQVGTLTVMSPTGGRRYLDLRYESGAEGDESQGVYGITWKKHSLTMLAERPFFYGDMLSFPFGGAAPVNFYGAGAGLGPPFHIATDQAIASATVTTPGDLPSWPIWTITGPMTGFVGSIAGKVINLPITLTAGQWIRVTTDPRIGTIVNQAGVSQWAAAGAVEFGPVPPFVESDLNLTVSGATSATQVLVEFEPHWRRAW